MKNFNIEDLKRETPYKVPENFFEEMQENVLRHTVSQEKNTPIRRMFFPKIAAAAAVIIGGIGIVLFNNNSKQNADIHNVELKRVANVRIEKTLEPAVLAEKPNPAPTEKPVDENVGIADNQEKMARPPQKIIETEEVAQTARTEEDFDEVLAKFSPEEIKQATENTEKDVYLDLYN